MTALVIRNARRPFLPGLWAVAVDGDRIGWIGPDGEAPEGGRVIDAGGAFLMPAFIESHAHIFSGGVALSQVNLAEVHSEADLAEALAPHAAGRGLLSCYGANYDLLGPGTRPDRHALDRIVAGRPLAITATDFHCTWANTTALEQAGILYGAEVAEGSEVVLGPDGLATGELREFAAMGLVRRLAETAGREGLALSGLEPEVPPTAVERAADKAVIASALRELARHGITTVVNMDGNLYLASLLEEMAQAGDLPVRVSMPMTLTAAMSVERRTHLLDRAQSAAIGNLRFGRVKMFMDGVFDTWTAFRTDDYPGRPGFRSQPLFPPDLFAEICVEADRRGLQIATHAVGDGAVRATLDGYEAARLANGPRDLRHRIEHIDMLHPADLPRLKALGVVASMQPVHPPGSSGLPLEPTISIMSPDRWGDTFPWAAITRAGVPLAFGTDWPVSPLSPFNAIHSALARQPWAEGVPDQRLPLADVLDAYTTGGAFADHLDGLGKLEPGAPADLVLLSDDPARLAEGADQVEVRLTIAQGRILYET